MPWFKKGGGHQYYSEPEKKSVAMSPKKGWEFQAVVLIQYCGFVIRWNCYDVCMDGIAYGIQWFWRQPEARNWVIFRKMDWDTPYARLAYDQGRKYRRVVGWTLRGPLVRMET